MVPTREALKSWRISTWPERLLDLLGLQHALHGGAQVLDRAVDHRVRTDLHALALGGVASSADRSNVEAEHHAVRGRRQHHVGFVDPADAAVDDVDRHLPLGQPCDLVLDGLQRTRDVGLEHQVELLELALARLLEDVLERDLAARAAGDRLGLEPVGALAGERAGAAVVLDHVHEFAASGTPSKPSTSTGSPGPARLTFSPTKSLIARTFPNWAPATRAAPTSSVPRWTRIVTTGPRPGSSLDSITTPEASAVGFALSSSSSATTWIVSRRSSRPTLVFADTSTNSVSPPHSAGWRSRCVISVAHAGRVGALLVDLVDRGDDRHVGRARVVDRLVGLRLGAVVRRHHDHGDVGDPGAAGAHGGERLVARRVQEGHRLAVVVDLVGADVLRDPAGFARHDLGLADRVQQRGLAVVDVAHDGHHGRTLEQIGLGVLEGRLDLDVVGRVDDLDLLAELLREDPERLVGERLGEGGHLPQAHQLLDHLGYRDAERLGGFLDRGAGVDADQVGSGRQRGGASPPPPRRRCRGAGVRGADGAAARAAGRPSAGARPASRSPRGAGRRRPRRAPAHRRASRAWVAAWAPRAAGQRRRPAARRRSRPVRRCRPQPSAGPPSASPPSVQPWPACRPWPSRSSAWPPWPAPSPCRRPGRRRWRAPPAPRPPRRRTRRPSPRSRQP